MQIMLNLLSGIALLAYGIYLTKTGVLKACGSSINIQVSRSLSSRFWPLRAVLAGLGTTALVQSSNATAMLVSSFLSKGIITLTPALTIMLGADLGTAVMARILTFDLSAVCPLLIIIGVFLFLGKRKKPSRIGRILIGLGLVLMALKMIVTSTAPVAQSETVQLILDSLDGELIPAIIFGALLAIICYSSLAAVLLTAVIASTDSLGFSTAMAVVIGANLGSCCLEILGSLGQGITARRVMFGNTMFKLTVTVIVLPFITYFDPTILAISIKEQVIWFHVIFNLIVCCGLLPLVPFYARLLQLLFPEPPAPLDESEPKYLDEQAVENPALALSNAVRETLRLGGFLHEMMALFKEALTGKTSIKNQMEQKMVLIENLSIKIRAYLDQIEFDDADLNARWHQVFTAVVSTVHAGDLIKRMLTEVTILNKSPEANLNAYNRADLIKLTRIVNENLAFSLNAFMTGKESEIDLLFVHKNDFKELTDKYSVRQLNKLTPESNGGNDIGALILILISDLRQLNGIFCSLASSRWAQLNAQKQMRTHQVKPLIESE